MKCNCDAEAAVQKVPFFARKKRYLENMEKEVKGYRAESCFGPQGCANRAGPDRDLAAELEALLESKGLLDFLKKTVDGRLKFHHEFSVTLADCPNACSRPQIKDIGIIGASVPEITDSPCTMCGDCVESCAEAAVRLDRTREIPEIDAQACLYCGQCAEVCPSETIRTGRRGYRVLLGGKLGRHPALAEELPGIYDADHVLDIAGRCADFYKKHSTGGKRFARLYAESPKAVRAFVTRGMSEN